MNRRPPSTPIPQETRLTWLLFAARIIVPCVLLCLTLASYLYNAHAGPRGASSNARPAASKQLPLVRFKFKVDAVTPIKDLLPPPPKNIAAPKGRLVDTLDDVPEVSLYEPLLPDPHRKISPS